MVKWHLFKCVLLWICVIGALGDSEQNVEDSYKFAYNVFSPESGSYHGHQQSQDAEGRLTGTYYLMGSDGLWHETTFSDLGQGFKSLTRRSSRQSLPELVKEANKDFAVFFSMGRKRGDSKQSRVIPTSINQIPIGSGTQNLNVQSSVTAAKESESSSSTTPVPTSQLEVTEVVKDTPSTSPDSTNPPSLPSPQTSTTLKSSTTPKSTKNSGISTSTQSIKTTKSSKIQKSSKNQNSSKRSPNIESLASTESSVSSESTELPKNFINFKDMVTPIFIPSPRIPNQPAPLDHAFRRRPVYLDFGPFSGKFGNVAVKDLIRQFKNRKTAETQPLVEESTEETEKEEQEESKKRKSNLNLTKLTFKNPAAADNTKNIKGDLDARQSTTRRENKSAVNIRKESSTSELSAEVNQDKKSLRIQPKKTTSFVTFNPPRDIRKINSDSEEDSKPTSTTDEPQKTSSVNQKVDVTASKAKQTKTDVKNETKLEKVAQANKPKLKIPLLKPNLLFPNNIHQLIRNQVPQQLFTPIDLGRFTKPDGVINNVRVINLGGQGLSSIPINRLQHPILNIPTLNTQRVVLPPSHRLVNVLRKLVKEKPHLVSKKPFFPLTANGGAASPNLIPHLIQQPRLQRNIEDSLTIGSNPRVSISLPHHLNTIGTDELNSVQGNGQLTLGQPQVFSGKNVNKFIEKLRNKNKRKVIDAPIKTAVPSTDTGTTQEVDPSNSGKNGLQIVRAKLNAVRLLEPMPLSQYKNLIERKSQPKATVVVKNFPFNQIRDSQFSETSLRPVRRIRDQILKSITTAVHRATPIRVVSLPRSPFFPLQNTRRPKKTKILMVKRYRKDRKSQKSNKKLKNPQQTTDVKEVGPEETSDTVLENNKNETLQNDKAVNTDTEDLDGDFGAKVEKH